MKRACVFLGVLASGFCLLVVTFSKLQGQNATRSKQQPRSTSRSRLQKQGVVVRERTAREVAQGTNLAEARAAVRAGLLPLQDLTSPPNPRNEQQDFPEHAGTRLAPSPDAKGDMLAIQAKLVEEFSKNDPQPESRVAHFSWIPKHGRVRQIGWSGSIQDVRIRADESMLVKIKIFPNMYGQGVMAATFDHVEEIYLVSNGRFQLVDSDAAVPKPQQQGFPLATEW